MPLSLSRTVARKYDPACAPRRSICTSRSSRLPSATVLQSPRAIAIANHLPCPLLQPRRSFRDPLNRGRIKWRCTRVEGSETASNGLRITLPPMRTVPWLTRSIVRSTAVSCPACFCVAFATTFASGFFRSDFAPKRPIATSKQAAIAQTRFLRRDERAFSNCTLKLRNSAKHGEQDAKCSRAG